MMMMRSAPPAPIDFAGMPIAGDDDGVAGSEGLVEGLEDVGAGGGLRHCVVFVRIREGGEFE